MRRFIFLLISLLCASFISCSRGEDILEEYIFEIERTDSVNNYKKNTNQNDSSTSDKPTTDTIKINKPSTDSTDNSASIEKDTIYVSYVKYMTLSPSTNSVQGAACYDKYLFQGYGGNSRFEIYNLETKEHLGKIDISDPKPNSNIHANSLCFGNQRVSPDDFFPVLYVSSGYTTNIDGYHCSYIYVYQILKDDNEIFSANLVQTITLEFTSWTEGIPDNDNNLLWIKYQPNGTYAYASFKMPIVEDGDVTLTESDIIRSFSFVQPFKSSNQGHIYHDNKILLVSGGSNPNTEKQAFIIINTLTEKQELVVDLNEIGLRGEPESIFFYKESLMIGYINRIYKFIIHNSSGEKLI
ncbi:MAG: hypothetical protein IIT65_03635 [Lachnospiraceae bacterium]|nr:hypothetical protein [Lachnospiraceae bacterium]